MTTGGFSRSGNGKNSTEWSPELERKFYASLVAHRPSGVAKHFMMALILNDLKSNLDGDALWKKLESLYDLKALEKVGVKDEDVFFQVDGKVSEFSLPKRDFGVMLNEKKKEMAASGSSNSSSTPSDPSEKKNESSVTSSGSSNNETPKSSSGSSKRPTRSTPGSSSSSKRRK